MTWNRHGHAAVWGVLAVLLGPGTLSTARQAIPAANATIAAPATLSGRLVSEDGKPFINGAMMLSPLDDDGIPTARAGDPTLLPDGRFTFPNVVPGRYQIRARAQTSTKGPAVFAVYSVEMRGADVTGIVMILQPGATIDGSVKIEPRAGARPPVLATMRVRAPFTDGNSFGDALTGAVHSDGAFVLRGVMKGAHQFVVEGLPAPWVVKRVEYRGADITDPGIDVTENRPLRDVRIVITDVSGVLSGTVQNAQQRPVANAGVLVFPSVPLFWARTNRRMRFASTDGDGRFTVSGLPAGDYIAVASLSVEESDLGRRDRLRALQAAGVPFTLAADEARATVTLRIAGASPGAGARGPGVSGGPGGPGGQ